MILHLWQGDDDMSFMFVFDEILSVRSDRMTKRGSSLAIFTCKLLSCAHFCLDF